MGLLGVATCRLAEHCDLHTGDVMPSKGSSRGRRSPRGPRSQKAKIVGLPDEREVEAEAAQLEAQQANGEEDKRPKLHLRQLKEQRLRIPRMYWSHPCSLFPKC